jgi:hypothetical protein
MREGTGAVKDGGATGTRPGAWWEGSKQLVLPVVGAVVPAPGSLPSLAEALAMVPEHRRPRGFKAHQPPYPLVSMLLLLLVGVLCGRRGYQSIADWARGCAHEYPEVLDGLGFGAGRSPRTPSGRTVFRFVRDMRARAFQQALQGWLVSTATALRRTQSRSEQCQVPEDQIIIDGKTVRGAAARRADDADAGLHLVSAYAPALVAVLDQLETAGKGQEMAAAQMLLGTLSLKGRLVTADALHTQRGFCQTVLDGEGDYLLPVKENQPTLLADLEAAFSPSAAQPGGQRVGAEWCSPRGAPAADAPRRASRHRARGQSEDAPRTLGAANPLGGGVG